MENYILEALRIINPVQLLLIILALFYFYSRLDNKIEKLDEKIEKVRDVDIKELSRRIDNVNSRLDNLYTAPKLNFRFLRLMPGAV